MRQPWARGRSLQPVEEPVGQERGLAVLRPKSSRRPERPVMHLLAREAPIAPLRQVLEPGLDMIRQAEPDPETGRHALKGP